MLKEIERTERLEQQRRERELKHQLQIDVCVSNHFLLNFMKIKWNNHFPQQARRKRDEEAAKLKQEELQRKQQEKELKRQQQMFIKEQVSPLLVILKTF